MAVLSLRRVLAPLMVLPCLVSASPESAGAAPFLAARDDASNEAALVSLEIDVIFPRNETYADTEILPVAIAVQHLSQYLADSGDFGMLWSLEIYDPEPSSTTPLIDDFLDGGRFNYSNAVASDDSDVTILVAYTNVTDWIGKVNATDHLKISVGVTWNITGLCDKRTYYGFVRQHALFQIDSPAERGYPAGSSSKNATSVQDALARGPACPDFAMIVGAYPYPTTVITRLDPVSSTFSLDLTTCSSYVGYETDATSASPCAATVGPEARSAVGSMALSLATSASLSSASVASELAASYSSYLHVYPSMTNAAAATHLPLAPAVAAAAVYCIVY